jgi:hypothetical protein
MTSANPYLPQIQSTLPRLLALYDSDITSPSYGMGDRYHWAWGLIDFGNGSYQGAANGLAHLWKNKLWKYPTDKEVFYKRIDSFFTAARTLTYNDGSLEEAFPHEGSYCVTALVAFDLLCAVELLQDEVPENVYRNWLDIIAPLIEYLITADETHALISNHLATAVAALVRWEKQTGEDKGEGKAKELMERILNNQSVEGWFKEYDGADPGYQTLCTYYLADVHLNRPDYKLLQPLRKSIQFLWYFSHPDGSFGGIYGSRNTRFYFPAGLELLADEIPEAKVLAVYMRESIMRNTVVGLNSMDESNLIPMFNAYCRAAAVYKPTTDEVLPTLPFQQSQSIAFPQTGIVIDAGPRHYTIINLNKGGVVMHFKDGRNALYDVGVAVKKPSGKLGSTQTFTTENIVNIANKEITVKAAIRPMPKQLPSPFQFVLIRMLGMTIFRFPTLREWFKRILVRLLITKKSKWPASNTRKIELGYDLVINDHLTSLKGYTVLQNAGSFISIHMASQGYWQIQDEEK